MIKIDDLKHNVIVELTDGSAASMFLWVALEKFKSRVIRTEIKPDNPNKDATFQAMFIYEEDAVKFKCRW